MEIQISEWQIPLFYLGEGHNLVIDCPNALLHLHSKVALEDKERWGILMTKIVCEPNSQCLQLTVSSGQINHS